MLFLNERIPKPLQGCCGAVCGVFMNQYSQPHKARAAAARCNILPHSIPVRGDIAPLCSFYTRSGLF